MGQRKLVRFSLSGGCKLEVFLLFSVVFIVGAWLIRHLTDPARPDRERLEKLRALMDNDKGENV